MADLSTPAQYYNLAGQLVEKVSKDDIAECARLLALNVAHYQIKHGEFLAVTLVLAETSPALIFPRDATLALMSELTSWFCDIRFALVVANHEYLHLRYFGFS